MSRGRVLDAIEKMQKTRDLNVNVGDLVSVSYMMQDGGKVRQQSFDGIVVWISRPKQYTCSIAVYKALYGGCLKVFLLNSPILNNIEVKRHSRVRRSRLYYILGQVGKKARLPVSYGKRL